MKSRPLKSERGTVWVLTLFLMIGLLGAGGLAIDGAHIVAVRGQLQKSMDSAALAGAGNLGFSSAVFPTARTAAQTFAAANPWHGGPINLNLNAGNAPGGDIVLGLYNVTTQTFTPSVDAALVNAVQCRYSTVVPNYFMGLLGFPTVSVSATSIGIANPPAGIPPNGCLFPMGVTECPFVGAGGEYGAFGCGQPVTTMKPSTTNTGGWINVTGGTSTPSAVETHNAVLAASGACNGTSLVPGQMIGVQGGEDARVYNGTGQDEGLGKCDSSGTNCTGLFVTKFNGSPVYTLKDSNDNTTYEGRGWEVYVPVLKTGCPPGNFNEPMQVVTFGRIIITQVINGGHCTVANHYSGNLWDNICPAPNGFAPTNSQPSLNAVFGYYDCKKFEAPPIAPAPVAALGTRLRLVE